MQREIHFCELIEFIQLSLALIASNRAIFVDSACFRVAPATGSRLRRRKKMKKTFSLEALETSAMQRTGVCRCIEEKLCSTRNKLFLENEKVRRQEEHAEKTLKCFVLRCKTTFYMFLNA